jgi:hypothetical protein
LYQIGDVHARSWIAFGTDASQHAASSLGTDSGRLQSTWCALHAQVFQRQLGFSTTRA